MGDIKRIVCYTEAQQAAYEGLNERQRRYVDFRALGYNKSDSYRKAGYNETRNVSVNACQLEKTPVIKDLVETRLKVRTAQDIFDSDSKLARQIDAMAEQQYADGALKALDDIVEGGDVEMARRVQFYRDIASGKIKSVRKTTFIDKNGLKTYKIEETSDVAVRVQARKELDMLLGLNKGLDLGQMKVGDITINFVDSTKKDEAQVGSGQVAEAQIVDVVANAESESGAEAVEQSVADTQETETLKGKKKGGKAKATNLGEKVGDEANG